MKSQILVVDDDHAVRAVAVDILKAAGYPILEAAGASHAMELLKEHSSVALLFTDINMPAINGYVLADMAVTRSPGLRVLYTTGTIDIYRVGERPGSLHGEMLAKPYRAPELITAVGRSLSWPRSSWGPCRRSSEWVEPQFSGMRE